MTRENPSKGLEWTNLVLGVCLACAAFMFTGVPAAAWNAAIVGTLVAVCSAIALYRYGDWAEWSNLTLGCWALSRQLGRHDPARLFACLCRLAKACHRARSGTATASLLLDLASSNTAASA